MPYYAMALAAGAIDCHGDGVTAAERADIRITSGVPGATGATVYGGGGSGPIERPSGGETEGGRGGPEHIGARESVGCSDCTLFLVVSSLVPAF